MCRDGVCGIHLFSIIIDWHPMVKIVFKLKLKYRIDNQWQRLTIRRTQVVTNPAQLKLRSQSLHRLSFLVGIS